MQLKNKQDFWSGVMFTTIGVAAAIGATSYSMGTSARMGPGYFPFCLGAVMAVIGLFITISALSPNAEDIPVEKFDWAIVSIMLGGVVLCGLVLDSLGVYISVFLLVVVSSYASHVFSWKVAILNGLFLSIFVWLAFVRGLGLIFPLWPSFLTN